MTFTSISAAAIALSLVLLTAGSALADPRLITDDAGTVEFGKVEIEMNGSYTDDKVTKAGIASKTGKADAEMKINTGLYKNLGITRSSNIYLHPDLFKASNCSSRFWS